MLLLILVHFSNTSNFLFATSVVHDSKTVTPTPDRLPGQSFQNRNFRDKIRHTSANALFHISRLHLKIPVDFSFIHLSYL